MHAPQSRASCVFGKRITDRRDGAWSRRRARLARVAVPYQLGLCSHAAEGSATPKPHKHEGHPSISTWWMDGAT